MNKITTIIIAGITLSVVFFTLKGPRGLNQLLLVNEQVQLLEEEKNILAREIEHLKNQIKESKESRFFLEKHAREELGLSREDEIVYVFPESAE